MGPPYAPYGLVSPLGLKTWFSATPDLAEIVGDRSSDTSLIDRLSAGDVILYHNGRSYQHSAVYLGDGTIACHTVCRYGTPWQIDASRFTWTFVRIKDT
jgi:cell wall-associated NlpC family hydrolase